MSTIDTATTENSQASAIISNVNNKADIENFYRFIYDNELRREAKLALSEIYKVIKPKKSRRGRKSKFKSLIIEKDFEPENPKQLEELDENSCKWPIGHPNEDNFYFCGRSSLKDFSYCKLHLLYAFQPKNRKEDVLDKDNEVPKFIRKKIKSA